MDMNADKLIKFLAVNISDWAKITVQTLLNPIARFELVPVGPESTIFGSFQTERQLWLNSKLLLFALLSIVFGLSISALTPNRELGPEGLLASVIFLFIFWLVGGSLLHLICRVFQGKGKYLETLSVSVQVSATLYVATNFLEILLSSFFVFLFVSNVQKPIPVFVELLVEHPAAIFFMVSTILHTIYVPLSMKPVHKFGWLRTALIGVFPLGGVAFSIVIYVATGLLQGAAT